jgi:hypothetical protein
MMSNHWTMDQVLALAPDTASLKAAGKLTSTRKWTLLAYDKRTVWGLCKGSGSQPYQARIDLQGPAFKCSCPSRKFPCKHNLALFQLYVEDRSGFQSRQPPAWVTSWLQARDRKATLKPPGKAVDASAQAKRRQRREQRIAAGVEALSLWLRDIVRDGIGALVSRPRRSWQDTAARMIDAQAPGLANRVKELGAIVSSGKGWEHRALIALGQLHLLLEGFKRLDTLEEDTRDEIRTQIGLSQSREEALAGDGIEDVWRVLSHATESNDELVSTRAYLLGEGTRMLALILNFAHPSQRNTLPVGWTPPKRFSGKLHFFRGASPLRCQPGELKELAPYERLDIDTSLADGLRQWKAAAVKNPWIARHPLAANGVKVLKDNGELGLVSAAGEAIPVSRQFGESLKLLAIAGTDPITVFGEYDGSELLPLGIEAGDRYWPLTSWETNP